MFSLFKRLNICYIFIFKVKILPYVVIYVTYVLYVIFMFANLKCKELCVLEYKK